MKRDSRLSGVLHILMHIAEHDGPATSEWLARAMDTNPVVIRRILAGLRDQGYVTSEKGHGGGWSLACNLSRVTLRDVYEAIGCPSLLAVGHRTETPGCPIEKTVNAVLARGFREAEEVVLSHLETVTLEALRAEFRKRTAARHRAHLEAIHAA